MELTTNANICSACFCQKPGVEHVDFQTAWDGPSLETADGSTLQIAAGASHMAIDELILCEECLRAGFALLTPDDAQKRAWEDLERRALEAEERVAGQQREIKALEDVVAARKPAPAPAPAPA